MRAAFARRAPCTTERPIPPRPITRTVAPSSTRAVFSTAPTPVWTAQPITHATSSGVSAGTLIAPVACTTVDSAKAATLSPRKTFVPRRERPVVPSGKVAVITPSERSQRLASPRTHQ